MRRKVTRTTPGSWSKGVARRALPSRSVQVPGRVEDAERRAVLEADGVLVAGDGQLVLVAAVDVLDVVYEVGGAERQYPR